MIPSENTAPFYDGHIHLVGNGAAGSGCWMRLGGWHRMMGEMMRRMMGMPVAVTDPEFDEIYITKLAAWVRESSLDRALLLAQDEVYHPDGSRRDFGAFHVPNDYLFEICKRHPEFVPAASIHPARRDAIDELNRCLDLGARALKLLPNCHDVDCSDPRFDPFWERMADAGLPLLAHTGGEMTVPVANHAYENPEVLRRPLEIGVKVIAAHCASGSGFFSRDYFDGLVSMMRQFPNLYADSSALNTPFRSKALGRVLESNIADRVMHGSDYPVPVGAWYAWLRGRIDQTARREASAEANPIQRDYLLKRAAGFDDGHFTRLGVVLRRV
ncbi:MAG: amidohydrolase family protein [Luteolibacter sp.]